MTMIQERYVSFEVAKMLKKKGFDEPCRLFYKNPQAGLYEFKNIPKSYKDIPNNPWFCAPSLYVAMEWLREKHKLLISIFPMETTVGIETLCYGIWRITEGLYQPLYCGKVDNLVDSYEAAVEAAIKYSLKNLI